MADRTLLFSVSNHHGASSGEPPHTDGDTKGRYHGYFENEHGEQAVFVYDHQTQTGTLWMGDNGWENAVPVKDGIVEELVLNQTEALWLKACWSAANATTGV